MATEMGNDWDADNPEWPRLYAGYFGALVEKGDAEFFVARVDREPAGMALVSIAEHYRRALFGTMFAYVNGVYVRERFRRRGIGTVLMQRVEDWARRKGCTMVRLRASEDGAALYTTLGFVSGREMEKRLTDERTPHDDEHRRT
jgi:GNAT superfamily N-acetyltransferase